MNINYYKNMMDHVMTDCGVDARMAIFFLQAIREAAGKDNTLDIDEYFDISNKVGALTDQIITLNPSARWELNAPAA